MVRWTLGQDFFQFSAVHALAFVALALVAIAETGRVPVDNPTTHLELTMIHEAMVLEYSGPSLALIEWASAIKLTLIMALLIALFVPWGAASSLSGLAIANGVAGAAAEDGRTRTRAGGGGKQRREVADVPGSGFSRGGVSAGDPGGGIYALMR